MRKLCTLIGVGILSFSASALAQGGDKAAATKPADKPAAGDMGMMAPKPAPELDQLKGMIGTWKCDGTFSMGGQQMKSKSTATFKWDLDKFFVSGTMSSPKSKESPTGYKGMVLYGYDAGAKQFTQMSADNMGGTGMATSKGWEGDSMTWTGKGKMMGMEMDSKETVTKKGDKQIHISGSEGTGAGASTWEMDCKK